MAQLPVKELYIDSIIVLRVPYGTTRRDHCSPDTAHGTCHIWGGGSGGSFGVGKYSPICGV